MNKMFKKIFAVAMVVSVAASMAVSASAADITAKPADGAIAITETTNAEAFAKLPEQKAGAQYTVMLFENSFETDYAVAKIYYINQGADVVSLVANMLVKASSETEYLPEGNYTVRIGNDAGLDVVDLALVVENEEITILYGDIYKDGKVNARDRITINQRIGGQITDDAIWYDAADLYKDGKINARDRILLNQLIGGLLTQADFPQGK